MPLNHSTAQPCAHAPTKAEITNQIVRAYLACNSERRALLSRLVASYAARDLPALRAVAADSSLDDSTRAYLAELADKAAAEWEVKA